MPRHHEPLITIRAVQPVVAALNALGHDVDELLSKAAIGLPVLQDVDGKIPHGAMMQFWQEAVTATGDDHLGIHLAEAAPIDSFGVHGYALLSSPTLREAYRRACRYQRLIHEITDLAFDEEDDEGILHHALPGGRAVPRHPAEFLVTLWVRIGRLITGVEWSPRLVCFAHSEPADLSEHGRYFRAAMLFSSGRTAIHVPNGLLDAPNQQADPSLARILDDYAERLIEHMPVAKTLSERVRAYLIEELRGGVPTAESAARHLHMSVRSLHRNLRQEGTTFRDVLSQLRQEQATRYLANPQVSISEVGFLLGFAELSSFYRAFKSWTGTTPAEYRARALCSANTSSR